MRALLAVTVVVGALVACGGTSPPATSSGGAPDPSAVSACTSAVDAVLNRGCTRCWPAYRVLCSKGNPAVVQGLLSCLTQGSLCWDVGDPNSAPPCMQKVDDANGSPALASIQRKLTNLGCNAISSDEVTIGVSMAATLSEADREKVDACLTSVTSCKDPAMANCITSGTSLDASLCKN